MWETVRPRGGVGIDRQSELVGCTKSSLAGLSLIQDKDSKGAHYLLMPMRAKRPYTLASSAANHTPSARRTESRHFGQPKRAGQCLNPGKPACRFAGGMVHLVCNSRTKASMNEESWNLRA
jgi:hypothetical protein